MNNWLFNFTMNFLIDNLLSNLVSDKFLLNNKRHFLLNNKWHLNFNSLNFCFMYLYFLIFNSVSVSLHRNFSNDLIRNTCFDLDLNWTISFDYLFYYLSHFHCLNVFFINQYLLFNKDLNWSLDILNHNLWHFNFNNMKNRLLHNYYPFNYLRYLNYSLNYPRHDNNFLYYSLNLDYTRHLNYLLYDSVNKLFFNFDYLFLDDHRDWFLDCYHLNNLLLNWN